MPDVTDALLHRMVRTIIDEVHREQVILFGSRGRGDAREDSDVDLLVVESEPFGGGRRSRFTEAVRLHRALAGTPVARDILVYSREEMERWRGSRNHVTARALREGRQSVRRPVPVRGASGGRRSDSTARRSRGRSRPCAERSSACLRLPESPAR